MDDTLNGLLGPRPPRSPADIATAAQTLDMRRQKQLARQSEIISRLSAENLHLKAEIAILRERFGV